MGEAKDNFIEIRLEKKGVAGFGFNLVGGHDKPHIPGINGFFVSRIREGGVASLNGQLNIGDRIISVDGMSLDGKSHTDAVNLFKTADAVNLSVEKDAEKKLLSKESKIMASENTAPRSSPSTTSTTGSNGSVPLSYSAVVAAGPANNAPAPPSYASVAARPAVSTHRSQAKPPPTSAIAEGPSVGARILVPEKMVGSFPTPSANNSGPSPRTSATERANSTVSDHVVAHNNSAVEVSGTPKKNSLTFFLDPAHNSTLAEFLFLSVGVVALGAAIFYGHRFYKNR